MHQVRVADPILATELRLGFAGTRKGAIHRSECSVGFWIAMSAQASAVFAMTLIALVW